MERTHVSGHLGPTAIIGCYWKIDEAQGVGESHAIGGAVLSCPHCGRQDTRSAFWALHG